MRGGERGDVAEEGESGDVWEDGEKVREVHVKGRVRG